MYTRHTTHTVLVATLVATALLISAILVTPNAEARGLRSSANTDASCMQTAVETRETALMTAFDAFNADVKEALTDRKSALNTAWGITDPEERNVAIKDSWKTWKAAHKEAFKELKDARKQAWNAFKATVKSTCRETLPKEEALTGDSAGSVAL